MGVNMSVNRAVTYVCDEGSIQATQKNEVWLVRRDPTNQRLVFDGQGAYELGLALIAAACDAGHSPERKRRQYREDAIASDLRALNVFS